MIVGDGPERTRLDADHVHLCHQVAWEAMPSLYALSDVYVHPSLYDRWPQTVSEALCAGLPVVASTQSGLGGFLLHGENALLVDGTSESQIYRTLLGLLGDEDLRRRLGSAGQAAVGALGAERVAQSMSEGVLGVAGLA